MHFRPLQSQHYTHSLTRTCPTLHRLVEDTAWHPVTEAEMAKWDPTSAALYKIFLGTPLKLWASVGHWWIWHFDLDKYTEKQRPRVIISLAVVYAFMFFGLGALTYYTGIGGLVKYWLMPWLGYHFWMSTFTVVHHTAPHIPFKPAGEWNAAKAQLSGTVHCDFPQWWVTKTAGWLGLHAVTTSVQDTQMHTVKGARGRHVIQAAGLEMVVQFM